MLSLSKYTTGQIAGMLQVDRTSVYAWVNNWNEYGEQGIMEGYRCGRPCRLTEEDKTQLHDIVDSGPIAYGFDSGVWTSPMVAQVIDETFGVQYHQGHVRKLLKALGFSVQRPTTSLVQAQVPAKNKWVRYTYPNLKKKHAKKRRR
jgi:transposase